MQRRLGCTHSDHRESAWKVYHVTHKTAQPSGEVMHDLVPQALWDLPQTSSSPPSQPCLPLAPNCLTALCLSQLPKLSRPFHTSLPWLLLLHLPGMPLRGKGNSSSPLSASSCPPVNTAAKHCLPWEDFH